MLSTTGTLLVFFAVACVASGFKLSTRVPGEVFTTRASTALTLPPHGFYHDELWRGLGFSSLDDFISRFWEAFWLPQDPNDLLCQIRKTLTQDPSPDGNIEKALAGITAKTLALGFTGDPMFPPVECARDAARIPGAQFREVASNFGHLATFALSEDDVKTVDGILRELLAA